MTFGEEPTPEARERVLAATEALHGAGIAGLRNLHPAYASVLAICDPVAVAPDAFEDEVRRCVDAAATRVRAEPRIVEVPTCYERDVAPDLEEVARLHGLTPAEVARIHARGVVRRELPRIRPRASLTSTGCRSRSRLRGSRRPRPRVPAGSVAIGGRQTGIYPFATPGGWRLIGRTPLAIFRADRDPPALLRAGDRVRFVPIPASELERMSKP